MSRKGLLLAAVHVALVLCVAAKYFSDRASLPRAWVRVSQYDPNLPIRGRYIRLQIELEAPAHAATVQLSVRDGKMIATPAGSSGLGVRRLGADRAALVDALAYFIPEHAPDPSRRPPGEELWAEVSVPEKGPPRPIRLGVRKDGVLRPIVSD